MPGCARRRGSSSAGSGPQGACFAVGKWTGNQDVSPSSGTLQNGFSAGRRGHGIQERPCGAGQTTHLPRAQPCIITQAPRIRELTGPHCKWQQPRPREGGAPPPRQVHPWGQACILQVGTGSFSSNNFVLHPSEPRGLSFPLDRNDLRSQRTKVIPSPPRAGPGAYHGVQELNVALQPGSCFTELPEKQPPNRLLVT